MVMTVAFELVGQKFVALSGGPDFSFNEAISFVVDCETQQEVDTYWETSSEGGEEGACGWLKDKFVLSWQVTPPRFRGSSPIRTRRRHSASWPRCSG
jgi:predicted 3-demethylubiquinone-9 3-methyltransferase (glyoxalase superfamily)